MTSCNDVPWLWLREAYATGLGDEHGLLVQFPLCSDWRERVLSSQVCLTNEDGLQIQTHGPQLAIASYADFSEEAMRQRRQEDLFDAAIDSHWINADVTGGRIRDQRPLFPASQRRVLRSVALPVEWRVSRAEEIPSVQSWLKKNRGMLNRADVDNLRRCHIRAGVSVPACWNARGIDGTQISGIVVFQDERTIVLHGDDLDIAASEPYVYFSNASIKGKKGNVLAQLAKTRQAP